MFACVLNDKLVIYSLVSKELVASFNDLRIRDLAFGDLSHYIYFGAFGDEYFGQNSRGGYGVILTNYYSQIQSLKEAEKSKPARETGRSLNLTLQGKTEFVDNCKSYDIFETRCDFCTMGLEFSIEENSCVKKPNKTSSSSTPDSIPDSDQKTQFYLNPELYEADISEYSPWYFTLNFQNLKGTTPQERQIFLQTVVEKKLAKLYMWKVSSSKKGKLEYRKIKANYTFVQNLGALWSEGKVLVKLERKNSQLQSVVYRLSAPDYTKRILNQVEEPRILTEGETKLPRVKNSLPRPKEDGKSKFAVIPAYLEAPQIYLDISEIFFGSLKLLAILIQIFLIFIRPCLPSTTSHTLENSLADSGPD